MVQRGPGHKRTSRVESSITADGVRADADPNAFSTPGFGSLGSFPVNDNYHLETRPEGAKSGVRSVPGDEGFLYSDSPVATVFLGKKQWIGEDWTYVVDFDSAEFSGRLYETQKRDIVERILTRKLRWLSDHESFTKVRSKLNAATQFGRLSSEISARLNARLNTAESGDPSALTEEDLDLLLDLEAVPSGFGNTNTTHYYTAPVAAIQNGDVVAEYNRKLQELRAVEQFAGPDEEASLNEIIEAQEEQIESFERAITVLTTRIDELSTTKRTIEQALAEGRLFGTTPDDDAEDGERKVLLEEELQLINAELDLLLVDRASKEDALEQAQFVLGEYKERRDGNPSIAALRTEVATLKTQADTAIRNSRRLVGLNAFNGIIEFNNITQVNTIVDANGQGTANFSMENPNNILRIGRDDILLAMSNDYDLDTSLSGDNNTPAPEFLRARWAEAAELESQTTLVQNARIAAAATGRTAPNTGGTEGVPNGIVSGDDVDPRTGNLKFYKGRYLDPVGLDVVLSNAGGSQDAKTGFSNSEFNLLLTRYRRQQQIIYNEIQSRVATFPPGFGDNILQAVELPSTYELVSSEWLEDNQAAIAQLINANPDEEDITTTPAYRIVTSYIQTLQELEDDPLLEILEFNPGAQDTASRDDSDPTAAETSTGRRQEEDPFSQLKSALFQEDSSPSKLKRFYRELQTHFLNKWIVEVNDRIWVWMTSPSRTTQVDQYGNGVIESATGRVAAEIQAQATVRQAKRELEEEQAKLVELQARLAQINIRIAELTVLRNASSGASRASLDATIAGLETTARGLQDSEIPGQESEVQFRIEELERIENEFEVPDSNKSPNEAYSSVSVGTATEALPLSALELSTYGGLEERQFQVFEGVVTQVTGTFNGEAFELSVQCKDLTYYLETTRVMERPSLSGQDTIALLNDPVYRSVTGRDREVQCSFRPGTFIDSVRELRGDRAEGDGSEPTDATGHPLAGRWKSGVFTTTALIYNQATRESAITSADVNGYTEDELTCVHGLTPYSKLYAGLDAGNLISILTTGIPFNFSLYTLNLQNASQNVRGGLFEERDGALVPRRGNPFESLRSLIGVQNAFLGNFQPFLELTRSYNRARLDALRDAIISARSRFHTVLARRSSDPDNQVGISQAFFSTLQLLAEGFISRQVAEDPEYGTAAQRALRSANQLERERARQVREGESPNVGEADLSDFVTTASQDGASYIRALIDSSTTFSFSQPESRLRVFSDSTELTWRQHFENIYGDTAQSTANIVREQLEFERRLLRREKTELENRKDRIQAVNRVQNESPEVRAQRRQQIVRIEEQIRVNQQRQEEIGGTLARQENRTGQRIDLEKSVTLSVNEVRAFQDLARARRDYNDYRELYNQFILNTSESLGLEVEEGQSTNQLATALSRRYNRAAIIPTKRKIIERRKPNFLLVSDAYVSDRALQPYQLATSNANISETFRSTYTSSFALCREAADQVDFEFFCDENGHLRFKPPTYNRLLKEHFDLELLRPELRLQLASLFPGLDSLQIATEAKQLRQILANELGEAAEGVRLQIPLLDLRSSGGSDSSGMTIEQAVERDYSTFLTVRNEDGEIIQAEDALPGDLRTGNFGRIEAQALLVDITGAAGTNNDRAKRELREAFDDLSLNAPLEVYQDAERKFQAYMLTYFASLREINKQIRERVAEFEPTVISEEEEQLLRDYRVYLARVNRCFTPELDPDSVFQSSCRFNAQGLPIADGEGLLLPPGLTVSDLDDPDERPRFLKEVGPDILEVIRRAPIGYEIPPLVASEMDMITARGKKQLAEFYTAEIKNALPGYLRAASERRLAIAKWREEVSSFSSGGRPAGDFLEAAPTSWLYVNAPREDDKPYTWFAGNRSEPISSSSRPSAIPDADLSGYLFQLKTQNGQEENRLDHRDVAVQEIPDVDGSTRRHGIDPIDRILINSNLRLRDISFERWRTLNGRDSLSPFVHHFNQNGDVRSLIRRMGGALLSRTIRENPLPIDLWFYLDLWRTHFNLQYALDFYREKNGEPRRNVVNELRRDPEYRLLAQIRFELIRSHYLFLQSLNQETFLSSNNLVFRLGTDITPQQRALLGVGPSESIRGRNVDLVTALELKALEELQEEPYFIDELHVHRIPPQIILQESFSEKRPDFVRLDVSGKINYSNVNELTSNFYIWGGGVDYDLWRTYGWAQDSIERPFLHDRETCQLYCAAMLSRQKAKVFGGTVTVRGDSKYRVSDCVFIEDQFMYYYITRVSHSFSYGSFTTQLELQYGRRPDDFITHPFDTLGSAMFNAYYSEIYENYTVTAGDGGNEAQRLGLQAQARQEVQSNEAQARQEADAVRERQTRTTSPQSRQ